MTAVIQVQYDGGLGKVMAVGKEMYSFQVAEQTGFGNELTMWGKEWNGSMMPPKFWEEGA